MTKTPIAVLTSFILASCASSGPPLSEVAQNYTVAQVGTFVEERIANRKVTQGPPVYEAYFNDVNRYYLLWPATRLKIFCTAKGGEWQKDPSQSAPPALNMASSLILLQQRRNMPAGYFAAYEKSVNEGAVGAFACTKDGRALFWARIDAGSHRVDSTIGTNVAMTLFVSTRVNADA